MGQLPVADRRGRRTRPAGRLNPQGPFALAVCDGRNDKRDRREGQHGSGTHENPRAWAVTKGDYPKLKEDATIMTTTIPLPADTEPAHEGWEVDGDKISRCFWGDYRESDGVAATIFGEQAHTGEIIDLMLVLTDADNRNAIEVPSTTAMRELAHGVMSLADKIESMSG
jgi:hypothetical protein